MDSCRLFYSCSSLVISPGKCLLDLENTVVSLQVQSLAENRKELRERETETEKGEKKRTQQHYSG